MLMNMLAANGMNDTEWAVYWTILAICLIVIFLAAAFAIVLVLCQKSNSDGIQGITASSETFFGKNRGQSIENKLKKWTWVCLGVMAVLSFALYIIGLIVQ